jgi:hypothetical protein
MGESGGGQDPRLRLEGAWRGIRALGKARIRGKAAEDLSALGG